MQDLETLNIGQLVALTQYINELINIVNERGSLHLPRKLDIDLDKFNKQLEKATNKLEEDFKKEKKPNYIETEDDIEEDSFYH